MNYTRNEKIHSYTYKDKLVEYSSKISRINFVYFMFIFVIITILFVSFLFISFPRFWYGYSSTYPIFFQAFHTTLRTIGIILAVLTVPGLTCLVLRFVYFFQLRSALEELSNAYPSVRQSAKRAADLLLIGVFGEIITIFVLPLLGNLIGGIMVMLSFNTIDQVLKELKHQGVYAGEENKLLFQSYIGFVVILPLTGILTYILVASLDSFIVAIIFASIFMLVLIISTIIHLQGFRKLSHSFEELLVVPQKITQPPIAVYEPPQKPIIEEVPAKLPQPIIEHQPEFKYCSNCGHKLELHGRFCSNCGANQ